jgi:hypothetical protein
VKVGQIKQKERRKFGRYILIGPQKKESQNIMKWDPDFATNNLMPYELEVRVMKRMQIGSNSLGPPYHALQSRAAERVLRG